MKHTQNESLSQAADLSNNLNSDSNRQLVEKKEIPETPFVAVKFDDKWYLTLGKYRLTTGGTYDDVIEEAFNTSWERIMQIIQIMIDENDMLKKNTGSTKLT